MNLLVTFLLVGLATLYVDFVLVESAIFAGPRAWLAERSSFLAELLSCYKCAALWSAMFCGVLRLVPVVGEMAVLILACAGAVLLVPRAAPRG